MVKSTVEGYECAMAADHRSGTISRTPNDVGKWNIIRNQICRQCIENSLRCCINTLKKSEKRYSSHSASMGGGANMARIHYKQGFVPMNECFVELEGEVGLL